MAVQAGSMRAIVLIEKRSDVQDAAGEQTRTWAFFAERRAEIERTPGHEVWASAQRSSRVPTVFKLRFIDGVTTDMRLTCRGKIYDILSVIDPDGRLYETVLTAVEHTEETAT